MSEKLYSFLLKLYPNDFRRAYGDEALRLVLERARDEKGFLCGLRLWLDLLVDLAISLPREYGKSRTIRILAANPVHGDPSFQLLKERPLNPALLFVATLMTAASFWICVTAVAYSRTFPARFPADSYSLQAIVQSDVALARAASEGESGINDRVRNADSSRVDSWSFCMTANGDIPSGAALIDGKTVEAFCAAIGVRSSSDNSMRAPQAKPQPGQRGISAVPF
jgi:hypothetical protein